MSKLPHHFSYKGSKLKPLRAFCQIARLGSITRAAGVLHLSQPAVSLQLAALERQIGEILVIRDRRRLTLTPAGEVLFEIARPLVEALDELPATFAERYHGSSAGTLDIAAGSSTIMYLLPSLIAAFRERFPDVELRLHNVTGLDGLRLLRADEVDLAFGSMVEVPADIDYAPSLHFDPMLICSPDHQLARCRAPTLEDISPFGLILPPKRLSTWRLVDQVFQQHGVPYRVALEVGGWEVIKQYVAMDFGISIVTGFCIKPGDRLASASLAPYFPRRSYGVVIRKGRVPSAPAQAFIDLAKRGAFSRDADETDHSAR